MGVIKVDFQHKLLEQAIDDINAVLNSCVQQVDFSTSSVDLLSYVKTNAKTEIVSFLPGIKFTNSPYQNDANQIYATVNYSVCLTIFSSNVIQPNPVFLKWEDSNRKVYYGYVNGLSINWFAPSVFRLTNFTAGNIKTLSSDGGDSDSGVAFGDDGTNKTVPTSAQMHSYVVQQLLNTPSLPFVHFATNTNISTFSGLGSIDGYTPASGEFLLLKNQTDNDNGIWIVSSSSWTRAFYNSSTKAWSPITTQTTYSDLNINGGILNVKNGTINQNLQYQFSIPNLTATLGSSIVYVTATTKIPPRDTFNGYVSPNIGNNTNFNGTPSFPYQTISQDLIGASYPHTTNIASSNLNLTENITFTSSKSNLTIQTIDNSCKSSQKTQLTGQMTFASGNSNITFKGTVHNPGSACPFIIQTGNLTGHSFEDISIITTGNDLFSFDTAITGSITIKNIDCTNSPNASIRLPNFLNPFTINIYNQTKTLVFSGSGSNCTINVYSGSKGSIILPTSFTGSIKYKDSYRVNQIITDQPTLTSILANTSLSGFYAISFSNPTGMEAGCIFEKISTSGSTINNIVERFSTGTTTSIYDLSTKKTYLKDNSSFQGWSATISSSVAGIPAGTINAFAGSTAPTGYLICNGSLISRTIYSALFSIIGTTYGSGDGSTTFKIPDLRGYFIRGLDTTLTIDKNNTSGSSNTGSPRTLGSTQTNDNLNHNHSTNFKLQSSPGSSYAEANGGTNGSGYWGSINTSNSGGLESRPINIALNYIIKY